MERKDRIQDQTTTTGTGTVTLAGVAPTGFRPFTGNITTLAVVRYLIESVDSSEWEIGEGVFTDDVADTLTRATVLSSSNAGSLVNFSAGTKTVSVIVSAKDLDEIDRMLNVASASAPASLDLHEDTDNGTNKIKIIAPSAVASDKVLTLPDETGSVLSSVSVLAGINATPLFAPRGFLINGKLSVADAAGITVAIKTLAGTDPSASDPVYCRIGDTVRSITSARSFSLADGTNWFNAGSAELATKEIDYFAYLVWDSNSSAVALSFARIPYANLVSDFTATTTNEKYCAGYSGFTTTDEVENIGRFAATLSAGAGYTWTVPTFTATNLIQRPIFETRWLDWTGALTWAAGAAPTSENNNFKLSTYKVTGDTVDFNTLRVFTNAGTTITQATSTAPFTASLHGTVSSQFCFFGSILATSGGAYNNGFIAGNTNILTINCASATGSQFRASGFYQI